MQPAILADTSRFCSLYEVWASDLLDVHSSISGLFDLDVFLSSNPFLFSLTLVNDQLSFLLNSFLGNSDFSWHFLNDFHEKLSLILCSLEELFSAISNNFHFNDLHSFLLKLLDKFQSALFAFPFLDCSI